MGVTAIKRVSNNWDFTVRVRNTENPDKLLNGGDVSPHSQHAVDLWIPWATSPVEFLSHHLSIVLEDAAGTRVRHYVIWQRSHFDGDFVRLGTVAPDSSDLGYSEPGAQIRGIPDVTGDRILVVNADGSLFLSHLSLNDF